MDAKFPRLLQFALWLSVCLVVSQTRAADYRTQNFLVMAPTQELAQAVGDEAERYRRELAVYWLGGELRPWPNPCPIRVIAGDHLAAQGVTTFHRAPVRDFQMEVVGSPQRILDSVLPHEVTHTVLATYFGRPLPRWADEGICTTVEHISERQKHEAKLREFLHSRRGIAMNKLFLMTEYPSDVLPMYAQGYSVCQFLIAQTGPRSFVQFIGDYMKNPSWTHQVQHHYGYDSLAELQENWLAWVEQGSGRVDLYVKQRPGQSPAVALASATGLPMTSTTIAPLPGLNTRPLAGSAAAALPPSLATPGGSGGVSPLGGDSWYGRLRQEALAGGGSGSASLITGQGASMGTSNQTHTAAQPQAEQGVAFPPSGTATHPAAFQRPYPLAPHPYQPGSVSAPQYQPGSVSAPAHSQSGHYWR